MSQRTEYFEGRPREREGRETERQTEKQTERQRQGERAKWALAVVCYPLSKDHHPRPLARTFKPSPFFRYHLMEPLNRSSSSATCRTLQSVFIFRYHLIEPLNLFQQLFFLLLLSLSDRTSFSKVSQRAKVDRRSDGIMGTALLPFASAILPFKFFLPQVLHM
eukprot:c13538_g1_i1 orf=512-1000(-)